MAGTTRAHAAGQARRPTGIKAGLAALVQRVRPSANRAPDKREHELAAAFQRLQPDAGDAPDTPIFILSAGWRSGSTLVQRLVMSSGTALVWGEPWNRCDHVLRLADSLRPINDDWPYAATLYADDLHTLDPSEAWVANLFPDPGDLIEAHRGFFRNLFASPAARLGYQQWGCKMVRLGIDEARYLRLLFPRARLILLYRNPLDAWISYKASRIHAYREWPHRPIDTADRFAANWLELTQGFVRHHQELDAALVRYETLTSSDESRRQLEAHLDMKLAADVLHHRVGAAKTKVPPGRRERRTIERITGPLARQLGY